MLDPTPFVAVARRKQMTRKVRDSNLETRTARSRLKARKAPYFRLIRPGMHLGYRKLASGPGTWLVRRYDKEGQKYSLENLRADGQLVIADDFADANGIEILDFGQAQTAAQVKLPEPSGPYTVKRAMDHYLQSKQDDGRDVVDTKCRIEAHILPTLGSTKCADLTTESIRKWHRDLAKTPPRVRTKKDSEEQKYRAFSGDRESVRKRQSSANRVLSILKAALNMAFNEGKVPSDTAWRKVQPFKGVDASRERHLSMAEAKRVINAAQPKCFRDIVQAALQSGGRWGQLAALIANDFNPDVGTVLMRTRKGDGNWKEYHVTLTAEGVAFFKQMCIGLLGDELIFKNTARIARADNRLKDDDNAQWRESEQTLPMKDTCERAKISPPIGFHILRHTWASHAVMNGVPLLVVAKNLGHSDTRMVEKHYGHLAPSYIADAIRSGAPKFGFKANKRVVSISEA